MRRKNSLSSAEMPQYFIKWKDGRLSAAEQKRLKNWLASSPANQTEWERLAALWNIPSPPIPSSSTSTEVLWKNLASQLEARPHAAPRPQSSLIRELAEKFAAWFRPIPKWAFAGAAILLIGVLLQFNSRRSRAEWVTLDVPFGQRSMILLPDSSMVEINAGSMFKYPKKFDPKVRQVELAGEAFFQVRHNGASFKVETAQATTQVLGTAFNIRTWNNVTRVFVQSGKVVMQSKSASTFKKIVLTAGQMALCDSVAVLRPTVEYPEDMLAWREGRLIFRRRILSEVLQELARHFAVQIEADSSLRQHTITADFSQESFAPVIAALAASINARYEKIENVHRLQPK